MPKDHTVREGESIMSLAQKNGLFWETVWNHPKNSSLRESRKDPDVIFPGDVVHIPDKEKKEEACATDQAHRFRAKGTPAKFIMVVLERPQNEEKVEQPADKPGEYVEPEVEVIEDQPCANAPYVLYADSVMIKEGTTDADGKMEASIPASASKGRLVLFPGTEKEQTINLNWSHMDPISETAGVCKRLNNLGYFCPDDADDESADLRAALRAFQRQNDLELTGKADDATRARLEELYGG